MSIELKQAAQQAVDAFDAFGDADDFASLFELTQKMRALRTAIQQAEAQRPATGEPVHATVRNLLLELLNELDRTLQQRPDRFRRVREAYELLYDHPAPSVPDGYALVPIEPTQAMMNAQTWDFSSFYSPREVWSAMLAAAPAAHPAPSVPDGLQWFAVAEHGLPEVGEVVVGGLWYTDPWLKPECATSFMWGQCRVVDTKHRDFKDGKQWLTFGPSHNQITHWARLNPPAMLVAKKETP